MSKEKNLKPSKELPLGFIDRQEQDEGEQVSKKLINDLNIPIFSISSLENLVVYLETAGLKDTAEKLKTSLKN